MLKAVLFDLNGLFITSRKLSEYFSEEYGIPAETFLPKLSEIMHQVRQPNAGPAFRHWEPVLKEWGLTLTEAEFWDFWFSKESVSEDMVALARTLKKEGLKVLIISNNFKERADFYGHYPWLHDAVDQVYFSFASGFVKPDMRAWAAPLAEHALAPSDCIYFDDQPKNIAAAESLGIESHLFESPAETERLIRLRLA